MGRVSPTPFPERHRSTIFGASHRLTRGVREGLLYLSPELAGSGLRHRIGSGARAFGPFPVRRLPQFLSGVNGRGFCTQLLPRPPLCNTPHTLTGMPVIPPNRGLSRFFGTPPQTAGALPNLWIHLDTVGWPWIPASTHTSARPTSPHPIKHPLSILSSTQRAAPQHTR